MSKAPSDPHEDPDVPGQPTINDLVNVQDLQLRWVLCEEVGKNRRVRWASTTELLDPTAYLKGGELVCTVGSMLTDVGTCRSFAKALSQAGVSALCFGSGDVHRTIPKALLDSCHHFQLPLVEAPLGAPFIAISEYLADSRVRAQAATSRSEQQLISQLLAGIRTRRPVMDLLQVASRATHGNIQLVDGPPPRPGHRSETASDGEEERSVPVGLGRSLRWRGEGDVPEMALLEQLARVVEVANSEQDIEDAFNRERVGQLLRLVGDGLAHPIALRPLLVHGNLRASLLVASAWTPGAAALLARHFPQIVVGETPSLAIALTETPAEVRGAAAVLSLPCGYGSQVPLTDIGRSIAEACAALKLARRGSTAVGPEGLTTMEGLLEQQPANRLSPFVDQIIQPLVDSDVKRRTSHVETLRLFLRLDGRLQATASEIFLHVNTVRHRLVQIHEITGRDPMVLADRMALMVALWAYDHRRPASESARGWETSG